MEKNKNVPKLRFPEFSGEWEEKKLGEIAEINSKKYNPEKESISYKCIELEHLASEIGQLLGFIDSCNSKSIKNRFEKGDVLYGKLRPYLKKYLLAPFVGVCSSEIWVLRGKEVSNKFLYQIIQTDLFTSLANQSTGSKMPRADWGVLSDADFCFPNQKEQTKIASFLTAVDEKLTQLKKKKTLLEQYKKGIMQKLFSQELRFKDDNNQDFPDWQEKTLGEVANIKRGASPRPITDPKWFASESKIGWVRISDVTRSNKFLEKTEQYLSQDGVSKSRLVMKGNIIMSICATIGKPIYTNFDVCIHDGFVVFENLNLDKEYLFYYLDMIKLNWYKYGQPGTQINLNSDIVINENIPFPCFEEQQKIATFLSAIDEKISHCSVQIEKMEAWKKGLLQQMFV